ncbi:tectonic-1 [Spea bombifrons]|uniref:tectonic-1 n=1 Tax=Spea bombifrons TaxID=233779 RepID=UPI00234BFD4B|nr:tectonic-1 [Spea bombifrons]
MSVLGGCFVLHLLAVITLCVSEQPRGGSYSDLTKIDELEDPGIYLLTENGTVPWEDSSNDSHHSREQYGPTPYGTTTTTAAAAASDVLSTEKPVVTPVTGSSDTAPPVSEVFPETQAPVIVTDPGSSVEPRARALPSPVTNVASLCVCDLLVDQCDVNCCCDSTCSASDFSVFSGCSIPVVTGDSQLCTRDAAFYSMNFIPAVPQRVIQNAELINPNVFCIQATNYGPALSFITPDVPTESNFDSLLKEFGEVSFNTDNLVVSSGAQNATRYKYGSPVLTSDSFLKLPASLGTNVCTDNNPIGFLMNQDFRCTRSVQIDNCSVPALSLGTYTDIGILTAPNSEKPVNITVQSIFLKSLNGTLTIENPGNVTPSFDNATGICSFVVLGGSYTIMYTDQGEITNVTASFTLGTIDSTVVPIEQSFQIRFIQDGTVPSPISGNPGYVVGLPLMAGFKLTQSGIIQSTNRFNQLTMLRSSADQNCLVEEGSRTPVLFGYNMVSGCRLRYSLTAFCQLAADVVLKVLRGQQFPDYVASFGNSQPQNVLDWVPITVVSSTEQGNIPDACKIPVSLETEVRWTKYGSLVNPQAKIVNVTQKISHVFIPTALSASERFLQISTSVSFIDVSAPAQPGYKAQPTIDAKLPFGFFHPFV